MISLWFTNEFISYFVDGLQISENVFLCQLNENGCKDRKNRQKAGILLEIGKFVKRQTTYTSKALLTTSWANRILQDSFRTLRNALTKSKFVGRNSITTLTNPWKWNLSTVKLWCTRLWRKCPINRTIVHNIKNLRLRPWLRRNRKSHGAFYPKWLRTGHRFFQKRKNRCVHQRTNAFPRSWFYRWDNF